VLAQALGGLVQAFDLQRVGRGALGGGFGGDAALAQHGERARGIHHHRHILGTIGRVREQFHHRVLHDTPVLRWEAAYPGG